MEEIFRRFCHYYVVDEEESVLEELKAETEDNFKELNKKAIKYVKNLRRRASKLGFELDFEAFCDCLENYINIKDSLTDEEKKNYLKVLISMSQIHEVNLREELERYVSYKAETSCNEDIFDDTLDEDDNNVVDSKYFKKMCLCILNNDEKIKESLRSEIEISDVEFEVMQEKAISFINEISLLTERLGFGNTLDDLYKMIDEYLNNKNDMNYDQKVNYLKLLMYLSEIYNVNLRELLSNNRKLKNDDNILDKISDPLENEELIKRLLEQRYNNGSFKVEDIVLSSDMLIKDSNDYDYSKVQVNLIYRLIHIFLDKFKCYCYDDLKKEFLELVSEEDVSILSDLTEEILYNIVLDIKKHEASRYICKKYKLSDNIYKFIYLAVMEVASLKQELVGKITMFNVRKSKNDLGIFISGPEDALMLFLGEYIRRCIESGLSYELKGITDDSRIILYTNKENLETRIKIIESISLDYPEIIEDFGCPLHMTGKYKNSFYGIASILKNIDYIDYVNDLLEVSYYRTLAKLVIAKVTDEDDLGILKNFISLIEVSGEKSKKVSKSLYSKMTFAIIKDTINKYIPLVSNTLSIYMEDEKRKEELSLEFRKSIRYISNVNCGKDKKELNNIAINLV